MRAFLAIEIPENLKELLAKVQSELKSRIPDVRWEKPEKLHLTLVFLGEVSEERLPDLEEAVREVIKGVEPFRLSLSSLGFFPNVRRPRVIWIGVEGDVETLLQFEKQLEESLNKSDFNFDQKKFHPHLTLGRIKGYDSNLENLPSIDLSETEEFEVSEVIIMKSAPHPTGSVYTPLSKISLKTS